MKKDVRCIQLIIGQIYCLLGDMPLIEIREWERNRVFQKKLSILKS